MKVKTGEIATVTADVDLCYQCSACGEPNMAISSVSAESYTPTIFGFNTNSNFVQEARELLAEKLQKLVEKKDPSLIAEAGFICHCRKCGHKEPWAKTNFTKIKKSQPAWYCYGAALAFFGFLLIKTATEKMSYGQILLGALLFLPLAFAIGRSIYVSYHYNKYLNQTVALPEQSIPRVQLHNRDQFRNFIINHTDHGPAAVSPVTPQQAPTGGWVCSCGRAHAAYETGCVCGKTKRDAAQQ